MIKNQKINRDPIEAMEVPRVTWYTDPGLRRLYILMPILFLGATTNGYDGSLLNGLQTIDPWQEYFNHPSGATLGLFSAILQIGAFSAIFFSSYLADILGRKLGIAVGAVVLCLGMILQVVPSETRSMFIGGRFLVGMGSNLSQGSAPLLIMELAHPQHRGKLTTMYNTLWYVGSIVAAWTTYGTRAYSGSASWRIPVGIQALMPVVQLCGIWLLPESPRWYISKGQLEKAHAILAKVADHVVDAKDSTDPSQFHANGDFSNQFVQAELTEIQQAIEQEKMHSQEGWKVLVKTPGNRRRLLIIALVAFFSQCSGNGLVSYYLHDILESVGITNTSEQAIYNGCLQIWSFLVAIGFSAMLVDRLGRKKLFMIAAVGMLVTFSVWTACSAVYAETGNKAAGKAVLGMIFLFYGIAGFAWPGLTVAYCVEILPYNIRAKGLALNMALVSCASILNQYVNPVGLMSIAWKFYFVYIVILIIECLCIWFVFVETKGLTLEEVGQLLDKPKMTLVGTLSSDKSSDFHEGHVEYVKGA